MRKRGRSKRRGTFVVVVLLCLIVLGILSGVLLRMVLAQRGQVRVDERRVQAEWLAEAGLERAAAQLAGTADYKGETWEITAGALASRWPARVQIVVAQVEAHPGQRLVRVRADYPPDPPLRARQSKQAMIHVGSGRSEETR
jgi:Tfp pilus assembly protein PilX